MLFCLGQRILNVNGVYIQSVIMIVIGQKQSVNTAIIISILLQTQSGLVSVLLLLLLFVLLLIKSLN